MPPNALTDSGTFSAATPSTLPQPERAVAVHAERVHVAAALCLHMRHLARGVPVCDAHVFSGATSRHLESTQPALPQLGQSGILVSAQAVAGAELRAATARLLHRATGGRATEDLPLHEHHTPPCEQIAQVCALLWSF